MYVVDLVVADTVNTMPEGTIKAMADHGELHGDTVHGTYDASRQVLADLEKLGISYDDVVQVLEDEGVAKFAASWNELLDTIKTNWALTGMITGLAWFSMTGGCHDAGPGTRGLPGQPRRHRRTRGGCGPLNPLRDPRDRRIPRVAGPCVLVMFGVTGDLARKKLMPAIYDLANRGLLPPGFSFVGFARRDWEDEDFAQVTYQAVKEYARTPFRDAVWEQLSEGVRFVSGEFDDDAAFDELAATCANSTRSGAPAGTTRSTCRSRRSQFPAVVQQLKRSGLSDSDGRGWRRVVIEKPFGHDLASARELNATLDGVFPPDAVFRIDHYLGKETVQNILALRFANEMYEPIWNRGYVDHVQITMAEDIGIGGRAGYYDGIGAARDVIQNHLLQLLALTAMEEPAAFDADSLRMEKEKVLSAVRLPADLATGTARGQYAAGWQGGRQVRASWRRTASRRTHAPRRTPRCGSASIPGAGPGCRSTCGRASGCRGG